jgi:hypothetical protein
MRSFTICTLHYISLGAGTATGYGLDVLTSNLWQRQDFCRLHKVQGGSGSHPVSYPFDTGGDFSARKASGA